MNLTHISEAITAVHDEYTRVTDEYEAFGEFLTEIETITTDVGQKAIQNPSIIVQTKASTGQQTLQVLQVYRETVMAVPHYDLDYGDTLTESLYSEFGSELTVHLVSEGTFTPLVKRQLVQTATQCQQERENLLALLETEKKALNAATHTLEKVVRQVDEPPSFLNSLSEVSTASLVSTYDRIEEAERACDLLLERRQRQRNSGYTHAKEFDDVRYDLNSYLYANLPVTYPVLKDTLSTIDHLRSAQSRICRELTSRI